jgi:autotransporter translocation and assembly factor TamB
LSARPRWRRALRWLGIGLGSLLIVVLLIVGFVFLTPPGTRLVLRKALQAYDDGVPGQVRVGAIEGTLGTGVRLRDVALTDRDGTVLVRARQLTLEWSPLALVRKRLDVGLLRLEGAEVVLPPPGAPGFADLTKPSTKPKTGIGPDLPVRVDGHVQVRGLDVRDADGALVTGLALDGRIEAKGRTAHLSIDSGSAQLPRSGASVDSVALVARWAEPWAEVQSLSVHTSLGAVTSAKLLADVAHGRFRGSIDAQVRRQAVAGLPGDAQLSAEAHGAMSGFDARVHLASGPAVLDVTGHGAATPVPSIDAEVDARGIDPSAFAAVEPGNLGLSGHVRLRGTGAADLDGAVDLACVDCRVAPLGAVTLNVSGQAHAGTGSARIVAAAAGVTIRGTAALGAQRRAQAEWTLEAPDLARAARVLSSPTPIGGRLRGDGRCDGTLDALACRARLNLADLRYGDAGAASAVLTATARPLAKPMPVDARVEARDVRYQGRTFPTLVATAHGTTASLEVSIRAQGQGTDHIDADLEVGHASPWHVKVKRLDVSLDGVRMQANGPTSYSGVERKLEIHNLTVQAGGGTARLDGTLAAGKPADLRIRVDHVRLSGLNQLLPPLPIDGVLTAQGRVSGRPDAPRIELTGRLAGATYEGRRAGDVSATLAYTGGRLKLQAGLANGPARKLALETSAPVDLSLIPFRFHVRPSSPVSGTLEVAGLDLRRLQRLLAVRMATPFMAGGVDATLSLDGTLGNPQADAKVTAHDVAWSGQRIGVLVLTSRYRRPTLEATLALQSGMAKRLEIALRAPVTASLAGGGVKWDKTGRHQITLDAEDLFVSGLAPWIPGLRATGTLEVHGAIDGPLSSPRLSLTADGHGLAWAGKPVGDAQADVRYATGRLEIDAQARHGPERRVALNASVPVEVDLLAGRFSWHATQRHHFLLAANGIDATALQAFVSAPEGVAFRLGGTIGGDGNIDAFALNGDVGGQLTHPALGTVPVALRLAAGPTAQHAALEMGTAAPMRMAVTLDAQAPVGALRRGQAKMADVPFVARLEVPGFPLAPLAALLPTSLYEPRGTLVADASARGTLAHAVLGGQIAIEDGSITLVDLNQRVTGVQMVAVLDGRQIRLDTFRFRSGGGRGNGEAVATWTADGALRGTARLTLDDIPIVRPGLPHGTVGTRVDAQYTIARALTDVDLKVTRTTIEVGSGKTSAPQPAPTNANIVYVDARGRRALAAAGAPSPRTVRLRVDVTDPVRIFGSGYEMLWRGRIALQSVDGETTVQGGLQSTAGRLEALGNDFELETGFITLTPEGSPYLDVTAATQVGEYQVNVNVRGRANKPELTLSSDPPLPQYQVLRLLVVGDPGGAQEDPFQVQREAATLLATVQAPILEQQVGDRLGVDRLGLGFGQSVEQPILTLGKRLTRDLYVETEYQFNAPIEANQTQVLVQYQIAPRWTFETIYGDRSIGSADIVWRITFGGSPLLAPSVTAGRSPRRRSDAPPPSETAAMPASPAPDARRPAAGTTPGR